MEIMDLEIDEKFTIDEIYTKEIDIPDNKKELEAHFQNVFIQNNLNKEVQNGIYIDQQELLHLIQLQLLI